MTCAPTALIPLRPAQGERGVGEVKRASVVDITRP